MNSSSSTKQVVPENRVSARRLTATTFAIAMLAGGWSMSAQAFVLGPVRVFSALGQPLVAEIPVQQLSADEAASLKASLATPAQFESRGITYAGAVAGVRVSLQRHASGDGIIRLSSSQAIGEPFVDVLLDLSWNSGQLQRSYTMLFDPPKLASAGTDPVVSAPIIGGGHSTAPVVTASKPSVDTSSLPRPMASGSPETGARSASRTLRAPQAPASETVRVQKGQTLWQIASSAKPSSVSIDQMLVALYRTNPHAFIAGNLNRMRAGAVLTVPGESQASGVSPSAARQIVSAHSRDFSAYRRRLAGLAAPAPADESSRSASGAVTAEVRDASQSVTPAPDKLTLSKAGNAGAEARIAAEGAKKDATDRQKELDKNLADLKKVAAAADTPANAPAPATEGGNAGAAAAPGSAAPASAAPAAVAATPPVTPPKPPVATPPAPQPQSTSFLDDLLENPLLPFAGLALVILLGGYGAYRYSVRRKEAKKAASAAAAAPLASDSFFGESGGQQVDTADTGMSTATSSSLMAYSPSQLDAGGEVDPVAEADVYLAYGREDQAEEILQDALRVLPDRTALHVKLCEIYAKQGKIPEFDIHAKRVHELTQGKGAEWVDIARLGRGLSPSNGLYQEPTLPTIFPSTTQSAELPATPRGSASRGVAPDMHESQPSGGSRSPMMGAATEPGTAGAWAPAAPATITPSLSKMPLASSQVSGGVAVSSAAAVAAPEVHDAFRQSLSGIDLDLGDSAHVPLTSPSQSHAAAPGSRSGLPGADEMLPDISYGVTKPAPLTSARVDTPTVGGVPAGAASAPASSKDVPLELDLPDLSLDLPSAGEPTGTATPHAVSAPAEAADLATRLSLAEEFQAIGNDDGAREIAREVAAEASGEVKARAEKLLAQLQ